MTDEQILKRLAEIEGIDPIHAEGLPRFKEPLWNPLTNWQDCGPLIEKYQVCLAPAITKHGEPTENWVVWAIGRVIEQDVGPDLKRAICLAIIEAHK